MLKKRTVLKCLLVCAVLCAGGLVQADESLKSAYAAILKGEYDTGRHVLAKLRETRPESDQVQVVDEWVGAYQHVVASRDELRDKTRDWNLEHAETALEGGEVYLALSFAAQAAAYAQDRDALAASEFVQRVRTAALAAAAKHSAAERWSKAHSYYLLLQRINPDDEQVRKLRESAARHYRLELIYETADDLERRIEGVNFDLLFRSIDLINSRYYESPDFKKMADGALDSLVALCTTTKLYEGKDAASAFDGVADSGAREYFLEKIEEQRQKVRRDDRFSNKDLIMVYKALKEANKRSVSLPVGLLIVEFMEGALHNLDDFTSIVWPADSTEFDKMMVGNFVGVGIQLGIDEATGRLKVVTPLENSPSLRAGIQPDDLIDKVDGVSTVEWSTDRAVREITGEEGTQVTLTIFRPRSGQYIDFPLERSQIKLTTIRGVQRTDVSTGTEWSYMLDESMGIAYVRLTGFNPDSQQELERALVAARDQGMRGLILDLRHNPGGLLDVAIETVSMFLDEGTVVETKGRRERPSRLSVSGEATHTELPLVVLVNDASASASEILAGALQDHDRAYVLGERTFGKGSVQRVFGLDRPFGFGSSTPSARLKLTTALYYLPNGASPHKTPDADVWGVTPDWTVDLTPKEFGKVLERERKAYIIHNEDAGAQAADDERVEEQLAALKADKEEEDDDEPTLLSDEDIKLLRSDPYEAPDVDPQLETALLHLRVKLAGGMPWPRTLVKATKTDEG